MIVSCESENAGSNVFSASGRSANALPVTRPKLSGKGSAIHTTGKSIHKKSSQERKRPNAQPLPSAKTNGGSSVITVGKISVRHSAQ